MPDAASFASKLADDQVQNHLRTLNRTVASDARSQAVCIDLDVRAIVVMSEPETQVGHSTASAMDSLREHIRVEARTGQAFAHELRAAQSAVRSLIESSIHQASSPVPPVNIGIDWLHSAILVRTSNPIDSETFSGLRVPVAIEHTPGLRRVRRR